MFEEGSVFVCSAYEHFFLCLENPLSLSLLLDEEGSFYVPFNNLSIFTYIWAVASDPGLSPSHRSWAV